MGELDPRNRLAQPRPAAGAEPLLVFAAAIFLGAFLIFQVQPMVSKHILPWFGGTPTVWTTCVLVFQCLLFAGYAYAHLGTRWLGRRAHSLVHLALLAGAAWMSVLPSEAWAPTGNGDPLGRIVLMLLATVGLPYFALSATGPLLQSWFFHIRPGRSPYALYSLSNAGSLLALLTYPFLVEPALPLSSQAEVWRIIFLLFVALCAGAAISLWKAGPEPRVPHSAVAADPIETRRGVVGLWIGWAACGVVLFTSVTSQLALNVASIPFLWVLPLSIYLLTFILTFSGWPVYARKIFVPIYVVSLGALYLVLQGEIHFGQESFYKFSMGQQIGIYSAALFMTCMICHGEIYRLRPPAARLTFFYMTVSFGGAMGGILAAVIAPMAFLLYQELHVGFLGCGWLLALSVWLEARRETTGRAKTSPTRSNTAVLAFLLITLGALLIPQTFGFFVLHSYGLMQDTVHTERNFFGILRVEEIGHGDPKRHIRELHDGAVLHGMQAMDPELRKMPTGYYSARTGVGAALPLLERHLGRRVGLIGLGVGTLAAWAQPEDSFVFYEINPNVVEVAQDWFTFLTDSRGDVRIRIGDARLRLEHENNQRYDALILDAFSSDVVPVHLLTQEAFATYERHLNPNGMMAFHISNVHLDLAPLVYHLAESKHFHALKIVNLARHDQATLGATWMILSRDPSYINALITRLEPQLRSGEIILERDRAADYTTIRPWTDDYSNLFQVLK
jgi:SAM-dependent methyltransferase